MSKTIIYLRVSTDEQNPDNQLSDCLSLLEEGEDYVVFKESASAWKKEVTRPEFKKVLKHITYFKYNKLIVWDLDRVYRDRKALVGFFELCANYEVLIKSFNQKWLCDIAEYKPPWNDIIFNLMIEIMGYIAEEESNKKSKRVLAAITKNRKGETVSKYGNHWGRKPISTFKRNKAFDLRSRGYSIRMIAAEVNLSVGAVHKVLADFDMVKYLKERGSQLVNK